MDKPTWYELRVRGHLDPRLSAWFDGMSITHNADGTTTIRGAVADQAALYGLLSKLRDMGMTLISVTQRRQPDEPA